MKQQPILFYGTKKQFGFLSNFYPAPFTIDGNTYPTNEHYYQSKKFQGRPYETEVILAKNPKQAKKMGKKTKILNLEEWQQIKEKVMLRGLRAKFGQNEELKKKLIETGDRQIREHTGRDKYWGDGGKKNQGLNRLGKLLMEIRRQLIENNQQ